MAIDHYSSEQNTRSLSVPLIYLFFLYAALPGIKWGQVCEEDSDRWGLRLAGQGGPEEESGQLAQAASHHSPDPVLEEAELSTIV